jgi:prepilin signal peptidase PulO-like enzyme (type II secretory pathway)
MKKMSLFIGSFLNVVIYRLPLSIYTNATIDLINPKRSFCPICKQKLSALELVPIFSYLTQKGKCKHCGTTISWQYPLIETMTALISALIVFMFGATIECYLHEKLLRLDDQIFRTVRLNKDESCSIFR